MKNILLSCVAAASLLVSCGSAPEPKLYEANWESLSNYDKSPEWFKDAKLGIYFHWGVYSVPAYKTEWYPRAMYEEGSDVYKHHKETYGDPSEFNYHDFVPMFKAEKFDPVAWANLFADAGARFAGPVALHHDGFSMWDSDLNPWNSADKGPKRDVMGELYKEFSKHDMKTIATFHHARNGQRYAKDTLNWGGNNSHFPYNPKYATSSTDPELKYLYGNLEEEEFNKYWLGIVDEVIEKYHPDIVWYDSWLDQIPESYRQQMVADQYNAGVKTGNPTVVVYKQKDLPRNLAVLDIEQGGMVEMPEDYWMTDITISNGCWCYADGQTYKSFDVLLKNMINAWSKRGIVLLNVSPDVHGVICDEQQALLHQLGAWLKKYGEAIYDTRAYSMFGYGDAKHEKGHFGGQSATMQLSASDVRFTKSKDGKSVYAMILGMPAENSEMELQHIANSKYPKVKNVSLVASNAKLEWSAEGETVKVKTPAASEMNEFVTVFKIDFEK